MNLVRSVVTNIGLALLSWVSILFVFATGNTMVVGYAGFLTPEFGWIILLSLVVNAMAGILVSGIWFGEYEGKWDFIALLMGFALACICLGTLVFITEDKLPLIDVFSNYEAHQIKTLISIPALAAFGCFIFFWKDRKRNQ
jgi:hypothetical protein